MLAVCTLWPRAMAVSGQAVWLSQYKPVQASPPDKRPRNTDEYSRVRYVKPRLGDPKSETRNSALFVALFFIVSALVSLLTAYSARCVCK